MDQPDQPFLLADLWLIHEVRSAKLDQLFHIVLDQLSRSAQLSRLNIPRGDESLQSVRWRLRAVPGWCLAGAADAWFIHQKNKH